MELIILDKADNDLLNIPSKEATKILNKINLACKENKSNIKKLTNNDPEYRLRVGNYRVLFNIKNNTMIVARVLHRKEAYKK